MFERVLADRSQLTEFDAILYMRQICKAVQYLHKNMILHLDLKVFSVIIRYNTGMLTWFRRLFNGDMQFKTRLNVDFVFCVCNH